MDFVTIPCRQLHSLKEFQENLDATHKLQYQIFNLLVELQNECLHNPKEDKTDTSKHIIKHHHILESLRNSLSSIDTLPNCIPPDNAANAFCECSLTTNSEDIVSGIPAEFFAPISWKELQSDNQKIRRRCDYSIYELRKDIVFLKYGPNLFIEYLSAIHKPYDFPRELEKTITKINSFLETHNHASFGVWITDRDGTINNYCSTYAASYQSCYNAFWLFSFSRFVCDKTVVVTSAPLEGLKKVSLHINDESTPLIFAGSKGREYQELGRNEVHFYPIAGHKAEILDKFSSNLKKLIESSSKYEKFALIGSGFQEKFGQTTIARQDSVKSIDEQESEEWKKLVAKEMHEVDPGNQHLKMEDTGLDLEIILTVEEDGKAFDKGNGVRFLNDKLNILNELGNDKVALITGDTSADLEMIKVCKAKLKDRCLTIFVTNDEKLIREVEEVDPDALVVPCPDVLVAALGNIGERCCKREGECKAKEDGKRENSSVMV